ncbi:MAG: hypothetical protein JXN60_09630, partial [Lentisphaerae bacterium]|nr:hypothetical protein [Lentisphaerota bacterium]
VDMDETGKALGNVLAVYSLALSFQGAEDSAGMKETLNSLSLLVNSLRPLGTGSFKFNPGGMGTDIHVCFDKSGANVE